MAEMKTDPNSTISFNDIIDSRKPSVETYCDIVDRFENIYSQKERYEDKIAEMFIDPLMLELANEEPVYMHGKFYERSSLIYLIKTDYKKWTRF